MQDIKQLTERKDKHKNRAGNYKALVREKEIEILKLKEETTQQNNNNSPKKPKPSFTNYDLIFHIESLKASHWKISLPITQNPEILTSNFISTVGIVGLENNGKTFLLNKICGFNLPSDSGIHTEGLSMKFSEHSTFLCLDSRGAQTPVYYFAPEVMKRFDVNINDDINEEMRTLMINDRIITDYFIQDFILEKSQIIMIVAGQMSQNDQKLIERICKDFKAKKKIVVIHNMQNLTKIEDVQKRVDKDIILSFKVTELAIPGSDVKMYVEKSQGKEQQNILHFVLGAENKESGNYYNKPVFEHLRKIIDTDVERQKHDIIFEMKEYFEENYRRYIKFSQRPKSPIELEFSEKSLSFNITTSDKFEVSNPLFNSLGSFVVNPPYEIFKTEREYICLIEIANLILDSLKTSITKKKSEFNLLVLTGERKNATVEGEMIAGYRNLGDFTLYFPLGPKGEIVKIDEESIKYKSGVLHMKIIYSSEEEILL